MHIGTTTHEHGASGRVFSYEGDYDVGDSAITWTALVRHADSEPCALDGSIPLSSPALAGVGEQAVRDAIVARIDQLGNRQQDGA